MRIYLFLIIIHLFHLLLRGFWKINIMKYPSILFINLIFFRLFIGIFFEAKFIFSPVLLYYLIKYKNCFWDKI